MELVGGFDGVLSGHGVGDEQNLDRVELFLQLLQLRHQVVVDMQAAGGIHQQHVAAAIGGFAARGAGQVERRGFSGRAFVDGLADIARDYAQLLARGGTVDVHRNQHRPVPVLRKPARQFAGGSGLAGALQSDDQEHAGRLVGKPQLGFVAAEDLDQLFVDDLDDLLGGRECGEHFLAHGLHLDGFDELLDNLEIDVGFEERHANFAQGALHIFGREFAFAAQVFEDPLQFFG